MYSRNMIRLPKTLAGRLTFWFSSAFLVLLFTTLLGMYLAVSSLFDARMDEDLEDDIEELQELYQNQGMSKVLWEINQEIEQEDPQNFFVRLISFEGNVRVESDLSQWGHITPKETLFSDIDANDSEPVLKTLAPSNSEYGARSAYGKIGPKWVVHLGESMEEKQEVMEILLVVSAVIFCMVIPMASFIGWVTARKAVSGIKEVSRVASDIKNGVYDSRVTIRFRGDEVDELANTFNAMADRIRKLIDEMREMTDNIAHDLRSPLARIRAISEVTLSGDISGEDCRKAASDTLEECDRLLQMINLTLDVAEAEADVRNNKSDTVDLSTLVEDACELFGPLADDKAIKLNAEFRSSCIIKGNKHNLQRMITNLIDNALKYTPPKGEVFVELENADSSAIIKVADTGIGIPEEDRHRVFDRFYRCDHSRTEDGCGLGLSFSRAVARAHGGDIVLEEEQSRSSVFKVCLPATSFQSPSS